MKHLHSEAKLPLLITIANIIQSTTEVGQPNNNGSVIIKARQPGQGACLPFSCAIAISKEQLATTQHECGYSINLTEFRVIVNIS